MKKIILLSFVSTMCFFESTVCACVKIGPNNTYTVDQYGCKKVKEDVQKKLPPIPSRKSN